MREYLVALPAPESVLGRLRDELAVRIGRVAIASEAVQDYIAHLYLELQGGDIDGRKAAQEELRGIHSDAMRREITKKAIKAALAPHLRWYPFFGQVVKLGSAYEKDGPDDGQTEAVFG